jgi:hypothetical protein
LPPALAESRRSIFFPGRFSSLASHSQSAKKSDQVADSLLGEIFAPGAHQRRFSERRTAFLEQTKQVLIRKRVHECRIAVPSRPWNKHLRQRTVAATPGPVARRTVCSVVALTSRGDAERTGGSRFATGECQHNERDRNVTGSGRHDCLPSTRCARAAGWCPPAEVCA